MKNKLYFFILIIGLLQIAACKKDSKAPKPQQSADLGKAFSSFSVDGELLDANISTTSHVISVVIPRTADQHSLKINFTLAGADNVTYNDKAISSGTVMDFSKIVYLKVSSADNSQSETFQIHVQTDLQYFGVSGDVSAEKSLNKTYDFYFDQFDGSPLQAINCGPTVTTMALKWADPTSTKKPLDARTTIPENGGWWYTSDIQKYLHDNGVNTAIDTLDNLAGVVKRTIDNNNLLILCLDMYYVPYNNIYYQHTEKFYTTNDAGWGHFLLVKGYKQTTANFYLEIYDPYSQNQGYITITTNQPKGKDRYYSTSGIKTSTDIWWPYTIIVAAKGQQVVASSKLRVNSLRKVIPVARGR